MVKIKLCGLKRDCDIDYANEVMPDYIGFIFAEKSRRYVTPERASELRKKLDKSIIPVGVFVNAAPEFTAELVKNGVIDVIQLHGSEDEDYIAGLRRLTDAPIIKAFKVADKSDIESANNCSADYVLLDSDGGSGRCFDHSLIKDIDRPYFLAGGLTPENVRAAADALQPYAVDASSSLETDGFKDIDKMRAFVKSLRACPHK